MKKKLKYEPHVEDHIKCTKFNLHHEENVVAWPPVYHPSIPVSLVQTPSMWSIPAKPKPQALTV